MPANLTPDPQPVGECNRLRGRLPDAHALQSRVQEHRGPVADLDGWFNRWLTVGLFLWALWLPVRLGYSVVGVFNRRADRAVVGVLRKWHEALVRRREMTR